MADSSEAIDTEDDPVQPLPTDAVSQENLIREAEKRSEAEQRRLTMKYQNSYSKSKSALEQKASNFLSSYENKVPDLAPSSWVLPQLFMIGISPTGHIFKFKSSAFHEDPALETASDALDITMQLAQKARITAAATAATAGIPKLPRIRQAAPEDTSTPARKKQKISAFSRDQEAWSRYFNDTLHPKARAAMDQKVRSILAGTA